MNQFHSFSLRAIVIVTGILLLSHTCLAQNTFIPNDSDYKALRIQADDFRNRDIASFPEHNYRIIYDFNSTNSSLMSTKGKSIFSVSNNDAICFTINNINTGRYKIEFNHKIVSFPVNDEAQKQFNGMFASAKNADAKNFNGEAFSAEEQSEIKIIRMMYNAIRELHVFYSKRAFLSSYDNYLLKAEINFISEHVAKKLPLSLTLTTHGFGAAADSLVKKVNDEFNNAEANKKDAFKSLLDMLNEIKTNSDVVDAVMNLSFVYTSAPVQPGNNDILEYNVAISDGNQKIVDEKYDFDIFGGWRANYGTGLFYTPLKDSKFIYSPSTVYDTLYRLGFNFKRTDTISRIDTVKSHSIRRDDDGTFTVGIGVMGHFYYKTDLWILNGIGMSLGTMLDNQTNIRYMLGFSLTLGTFPTLTLSAGVIAGKVTQLGSGLQENQDVRDVPDGGSVPTRNVWSSSWYCGLTYNFGGNSQTTGKQ